jgi:tetratricopeptide (TPR) repeat protein
MRRSALQKTSGLDSTFHFLLDHHLWIQFAQLGKILHVPQTWAAARYHAEAKNRAKAAEFGREAFRILEWAQQNKSLAPVLGRVSRRARAAANRVDARYLLDGGQTRQALQAWIRALVIHPPTALARLNILGSILLRLIKLDQIRELILQRRKERYK